MAIRYLTTAAILVLFSGAAMADADRPASECAKAATSSASGGSATTASTGSGGPAALASSRTRANVHAEAVEAARQDRPTLARELDFLTW